MDALKKQSVLANKFDHIVLYLPEDCNAQKLIHGEFITNRNNPVQSSIEKHGMSHLGNGNSESVLEVMFHKLRCFCLNSRRYYRM